MRIMMVVKPNSVTNPYVNSLVDGLIKCGNEVVCSLEDFWDSYRNYDLLYFQWPDAIYQWKQNLIDIVKVSNHLDKIKRAGIKMLITCHNLHPHNNDAMTKKLYDLVYDRVDAFHHLGNYSFQLMKAYLRNLLRMRTLSSSL